MVRLERSDMQDDAPPWATKVRGTTAVSVDARVVTGTSVWLVAFGWYVILQATPRGALSVASTALLYGGATFLAGLCFGAGEDQLAALVRSGIDRPGLLFGGLAIATTGLSWFWLVAASTTPYAGGLWLGVLLLAAGIALGVASR
jgi:hypothetical protein